MKTIISVLVIALLSGCGQSKKQLMNNLISEKNLMKDSLAYINGMEAYFSGQAKQSMKNKSDTLQSNPWSDSSAVYLLKGQKMEEKIKAASFSIDSLKQIK